jgi:hypothetical protein
MNDMQELQKVRIGATDARATLQKLLELAQAAGADPVGVKRHYWRALVEINRMEGSIEVYCDGEAS